MEYISPLTIQPNPYIADVTGRPVDKGFIFIGQPNKDPEFYPINVYADEEMTQKVEQPLRTKAGYISVNGDVSEIYASEQIYSVKIADSLNRKIVYKSEQMRNNITGDVVGTLDAAISQVQADAQASLNEAVVNNRELTVGIINDTIKSTVVSNTELTDAIVAALPVSETAIARTQKSKNKDYISVKDFGAVGDGIADDTLAIQAAINYAGIQVENDVKYIPKTTARLDIPSGIYKITAPLVVPSGVVFQGAGSASTVFKVYSSVGGLQTDRTLDKVPNDWRQAYHSNIMIRGVRFIAQVESERGVDMWKAVRNCILEDVHCEGFNNNFYVERSWTLRINDCRGDYAKFAQIYIANLTDGLHINGGRYDTSEKYGIYADSNVNLQLIDSAFQYCKDSAIKAVNFASIHLERTFFEGNTQESPNSYAVELTRPTLTEADWFKSVSISECTFIVLQVDWAGLGTVFVENVPNFRFIDRMTSNGQSKFPVIGAGVKNVIMDLHSDHEVSGVYNNMNYGAAAVGDETLTVRQVSHPTKIYGADMNNFKGFSPSLYGALNVGKTDKGVMVGTFNNTGSIQAYGDSFTLKLNPHAGKIQLGKDATVYIDADKSTYNGGVRFNSFKATANTTPSASVTHVTANAVSNNITVDLANHTPDAGKIFTICKDTSSAYTVTVVPKTGVTISGKPSVALSKPWDSIILMGTGSTWVVMSKTNDAV